MSVQFDVCSLSDGTWVVVQADSINVYDTRIVIPFIASDDDRSGVSRLTPALTINEETRRLATPLLSAVPRKSLSAAIASIEGDRLTIQSALDLLLNGS